MDLWHETVLLGILGYLWQGVQGLPDVLWVSPGHKSSKTRPIRKDALHKAVNLDFAASTVWWVEKNNQSQHLTWDVTAYFTGAEVMSMGVMLWCVALARCGDALAEGMRCSSTGVLMIWGIPCS